MSILFAAAAIGVFAAAHAVAVTIIRKLTKETQ